MATRGRKRRLPVMRGPLERNELALTVADLVPLWARRWMRVRNIRTDQSYRAEDAEQQAWLGVMVAASYFDPARGVLFRTYARHWARRYLGDGAGQSFTVRRPLLVADRYARHRAARETQVAALMPDGRAASPPQEAVLRETVAAVRVALGKLHPRYREVLTRTAAGETQEEVAGSLGVSKQAVNQAVGKARAKLAPLLRAFMEDLR